MINIKHFTMALTMLALGSTTLTAQKIDDKEIEFQFIQLPKNYVDRNIKNYQSIVVSEYASQILIDQQKAQEEFDKAVADYPELEKKEKERYDERLKEYEKNLAEYNNKSVGKKFVEKQVLNENTKPVHPGNYYPPARPVLRTINSEKLFSEDLLATSYLKLDGYKNSTENALKITATLFGYESLPGEVKSSTTRVAVKGGFNDVTKYWYEMKYKHPISLKIELPDGQVLFNETFSRLSEYSTYSTTPNTSRPNVNPTTLNAQLQEQIVAANMKFIQFYLNENYGFSPVKRKIDIYNVESKKMQYPEYQEAYENASMAYNYLKTNPEQAQAKLLVAIEKWETALKESDIENKKARINEEITIKTYFNLLEAYVHTGNFMAADEAYLKLNRLDLGRKERKLSEAYEEFIKGQRERWQINHPE